MRSRPAALGLSVLLVGLLSMGLSNRASATSPARSPLKHILLVTQDHRSFDHYFGTRPGVDGLPKGTCMPTGSVPSCTPPFHLSDSSALTPLNDQRRYLEAQLDKGRMDGFVTAYKGTASDGRQTMGYYDRTDLPYYGQLADEFMLFDHYHAALPENGVANRYFAVTATPPPRAAATVPARGWPDVPTIFDRMTAAGVSWKIYVQRYTEGGSPSVAERRRLRDRVPLLGLAKYSNANAAALTGRVVGLEQYYTDAAQDTLPSVSYVVATGPTERPPAAPTAGQAFVRGLVTTLQSSKAWSSSALLLDYDSSGGWYDHVAPPPADGAPRGARVPALLISPFTHRGAVDSDVLDSAAGLRLVEDVFGLAPLSARDAHSASLLKMLDLGARPTPKLTGTPPVVGTPPKQTIGIYLTYGMAVLVAGLCGVRLRRTPPTVRALGTALDRQPVSARE